MEQKWLAHLPSSAQVIYEYEKEHNLIREGVRKSIGYSILGSNSLYSDCSLPFTTLYFPARPSNRAAQLITLARCVG